MALIEKSTVKTEIGMETSWFFPITEEPAGKRPVYGAKVDMGHAVKGYVSVTTATASIPGDDITQVEAEEFVSGQADVETTMSDLEVNATLYGHKYTSENGEVSSSGDTSANGGYAFVEPILKKDKKKIYRATCLHKVCAISSSEKQQADTKKNGQLSPKNYAVSFRIMPDNTKAWRTRQDFATLDEAHAFIEATFPKAAT